LSIFLNIEKYKKSHHYTYEYSDGVLFVNGRGTIQFVPLPLVIYPAICRAVRPPPQNSAKVKKLGGGSIARKGPIGEG